MLFAKEILAIVNVTVNKGIFDVDSIHDIDIKMINSVTLSEVKDFIDNLTIMGKASSTIHRKLNSLSSLYNWIIKYHDDSIINIFANIISLKPKLSYTPTEYLSHSEIEKFLSLMKTDTLIDLWNKAIINLIIDTGIRRSDIINIKIKDINIYHGINVIILNHSNNTRKIMQITPGVNKLISEYIKKTNRDLINNAEEYLFISHSTNTKSFTGKLHPVSLNKMINKVCKQMEIDKKLNLRSFRHSAIVSAFENGDNIKLVKSLTSSDTTNNLARYINSMKEIQKY